MSGEETVGVTCASWCCRRSLVGGTAPAAGAAVASHFVHPSSNRNVRLPTQDGEGHSACSWGYQWPGWGLSAHRSNRQNSPPGDALVMRLLAVLSSV